jgi:hypothetical protein
VSLNEVGIQTVPTAAGYTGTETAGWNVNGDTGSEDYQAQWYKELIDAAQCDADITNVNIFKLIDQSDLSAWQSGLYQLGWLAKESASVVRTEIANVKSCPTGTAAYWQPAGTAGTSSDAALNGLIIGQLSDFFAAMTTQLFQTGMQQLFQQVSATFTTVLQQFQNLFGIATQQLSGTITLRAPQFPTNGRRLQSADVLKSLRGPKVLTKKFTVKKGKKVVFPKLGKVPAGSYAATVVLKGATGTPLTVVTPAFNVNAQGKIVKSLKPAKKAKAKAKKKVKPKHKTKAKPKAKHKKH